MWEWEFRKLDKVALGITVNTVGGGEERERETWRERGGVRGQLWGGKWLN